MKHLTETMMKIVRRLDRKNFCVKGGGSYVCVFMRDGVPFGDVCFFDGNRSVADLKSLRDVLDRAIRYMEEGDV